MLRIFLIILASISTIGSLNVKIDGFNTVFEAEVSKGSILDYYYKVPSKYFIDHLIKNSYDERKDALAKLMEDERLGKNKELFEGENKNYKANNPDNYLAIVDEKNYYLEMNPNESYGDWSQGFSMAVLIKSNGEHLVAVESHDCGLWCKPENTIMFILSYKDGVWTDVSNEALPMVEIKRFVQNEIQKCKNARSEDSSCVEQNAGIAYKLPQEGTTISAYNGLSEGLFRLEWKDDKFHFIGQ